MGTGSAIPDEGDELEVVDLLDELVEEGDNETAALIGVADSRSDEDEASVRLQGSKQSAMTLLRDCSRGFTGGASLTLPYMFAAHLLNLFSRPLSSC
jgi:hypothetical protein